jgi:hypothetical protein
MTATSLARGALFAVGVICAPGIVKAQVAPLGERVRVTARADDGSTVAVIGRVTSSTPDTLTVQPSGGAAARSIPVDRITRLAMSDTSYHHGLVGIGAGAGAGSFVGAMIGLANTPEPDCSGDRFFCDVRWSDLRPTFVGMVSGAAIGAVIGGIIGHAMGHDHWIERPLGSSVGVVQAHRSTGLRVSVAF